MKGGEIVRLGFRPADELHAAVLPEEELGAAELAVVVEAHGVAVGPGVEDDEPVPPVDFGQLAVDGEFVVVFTEGAGNVVSVVMGAFSLPATAM